MSRFLVEHRHRAETCPAGNPTMANALAGHLSPANGSKHGVDILADCVLPGEHILYAVVESESEDRVRDFFIPFRQAGSVSIKAVTTCATVAAQAHD